MRNYSDQILSKFCQQFLRTNLRTNRWRASRQALLNWILLSPLRWRQHTPSKRQNKHITLHDIKIQIKTKSMVPELFIYTLVHFIMLYQLHESNGNINNYEKMVKEGIMTIKRYNFTMCFDWLRRDITKLYQPKSSSLWHIIHSLIHSFIHSFIIP